MDVQIDSEVESHMDVLPGEVDNVHVQCKQLYGEGSFMCVSEKCNNTLLPI